MFTRSGNSTEFDSVLAVKARMSMPEMDGRMDIVLLMMYLQKDSNISYGTCKMTHNLMSPETLELFDQFLKSAEQDFGERVFGEGVADSGSQGPKGSAEDPTGSLSQSSLGGV